MASADLAVGHLRVIALTLAGTILDAEALVTHEWWDVYPASFVADSTELLGVQRPLLEPARLPVCCAVRLVSI